MGKKYQQALEEVNKTWKTNRTNLKLYRPLIEAFEESDTFSIDYTTYNSMRIYPEQKDLSAKELSILLDEVLFPLPFLPTTESVDSSDLNIHLGNYPNRFSIYVTLSGHSKCRVIEMSSKTRILTIEDKTYAIHCEA